MIHVPEISSKETYPEGMKPSKNCVATVPSTTVIYTTASADYDWWFTTELGVAGTIRGKAVRKVEIPVSRVEEQCDRYASGLHMTADEADWRKLVGFKLAMPSL